MDDEDYISDVLGSVVWFAGGRTKERNADTHCANLGIESRCTNSPNNIPAAAVSDGEFHLLWGDDVDANNVIFRSLVWHFVVLRSMHKSISVVPQPPIVHTQFG